jgi:hypothetical protein
MGVATDLECADIEATLKLARREINRQEPDQAITHLRSVGDRINNHEGTLAWAEYPLLFGEAYAAKNVPEAQGYFEEALSRVATVVQPNAELRFRVHRSYGGSLSRRRLWRRALEHYELAEPYAVESGLREELADLNLKIIEAQLQVSKDPKASWLQGLRAVGYKMHCTAQRVLSAWRLLEQRSNEVRAQAVFLREVPEAPYFEELIDEVSRDSGED